MADITIENIIVYTQIADSLDIKRIAEKLPAFKYSPNEFNGLTLKLDNPNAAVLLLSDGKAICTGAKKIEDAEDAIKKSIDKLTEAGIQISKDFEIKTQNIIASMDLKKELELELLSEELSSEDIDYDPEKFPGLIYKMKDIDASLIVFSSGKIVCTGTKKIEDATNAIEMMKEKISSLGVL